MQFKGDINQLTSIVEGCGLFGDWSEDGAGKHTLRCPNGAVLSWWPSKGTIIIQGKADAKQHMESVLESAISDGVERAAIKTLAIASSLPAGKRIFIVHGHDTGARDQLELALRRLEVEPFILMNSSGGGKTLIEALEGHIGRDYSSAFGIVLMTPDDMGYAMQDGESKIEPRARQNVILETGMLLSSLTRKRMTLIVKGHIELPSDLQGIIRLGYNDHIREIVPKLCQRLKECGFEISAEAVSTATA